MTRLRPWIGKGVEAVSKPQPALLHKTDFREIAAPRPEFRDPDQSPLYDEVDAKRRAYLQAVTAWQAQAKPTDEQVTDEATGLAGAFAQITMVLRGHRNAR